MKASYDKWRARLAGEKVQTFTEPDENDCGFYRLPEKVKQPNGRWKVVGYKPVALFVSEGALFCQIGGAVVDDDRRNDAWTWFVQNPITEEVWRAVSERGEPWPDFTAPADLATEPSSIMPGHVTFVGPGSLRAGEITYVAGTPDQKIAAEIEKATAELAKFAKIESDEQSSKARSLQQRFLDARGAASKAYDEANRPLLDAQKKLREVWFPLRDQADAGSNTLRAAMGAFNDVKREAARRAQAETDRRAAEYAEAVRKAEAADKPAPPPPEPVKVNTPPPAAQIKAPGARTATIKVEKFVTAIDVDAVFAQFKGNAELTELLTALAQKAIRAGVPVPGATVEERSTVR